MEATDNVDNTGWYQSTNGKLSCRSCMSVSSVRDGTSTVGGRAGLNIYRHIVDATNQCINYIAQL